MRAPTKSSPPPATSQPATASRPDRDASYYAHRHLRFGWWALLVFLSLGIVLEIFHGFKVGWYLDVTNETRRLMWTLGHAHGTLLALVNIAYGATVGMLHNPSAKLRAFVSGCLLAATLLIPGGFILGGVVIYSGDPGLGIILLPLGAVFLLTSVFLIARNTKAPSGSREMTGRSKPPR